jgi:multimeric flavodoxin WrbA/putative sterol carrier protein
MKILAINSSPRGGGQSKTELMLNHLVKGMREAGADVEPLHLREKNIKNCIGCYTCWTKTPGRCIHKDEMTLELYPKWLESDIVVYATPVYVRTLNAALKTFIERTLPVVVPFFENVDGRTFHPLRDKHPAMVMLAVAGVPDEAEFQLLSDWVKYQFGEHGRELLAEIYRPTAELLTTPVCPQIQKDIFDATESAGKELVKTRSVSAETMDRIKQPILDTESFMDISNAMWQTCITNKVTPKEMVKKGIVPRPDSISTLSKIYVAGFNVDAGKDLEAIIQFHFSGEENGSCFFTITRGNISASLGNAEKPDLTIEAPFELWLDIMTGKADGQQMFMEGKYSTEGNLDLLINFNRLFDQ